MLVLALASITPALWAKDAKKADAPAPAAKKAATPAQAPAAGEFEAAGKAVGEDAPADKPAEGEAPVEGEEGQKKKPGKKPQDNMLGSYFPFIMIGGFLLLWIFMGRGRKKKEAQRRQMLESLSKGDRVVTIGGVVGTIIEIRDDEIVVKVDDNTRMKFARWAVRNAGDAANEDKKKDSQEQQ